MKTRALYVIFFVSFPVLWAGDPVIGSSRADVLAALGEPSGEASVGGRSTLYYERGTVELTGGQVSRFSLVSKEDYAEHIASEAAEAERLRARAELRRARLTTEGEALKARKLADPGFAAAPLSYQAAFWQDFARKYPDVPCAEQLAVARLRLAGETAGRRAEEERENRLAELETRLAIAEARAGEAAARQVDGYYPSYYRYHARVPFTLWPIKYDFGDPFTAVSPVRSPGLVSDTPGSDRTSDKAFHFRRSAKSGKSHFRPALRSRTLSCPRL